MVFPNLPKQHQQQQQQQQQQQRQRQRQHQKQQQQQQQATQVAMDFPNKSNAYPKHMSKPCIFELFECAENHPSNGKQLSSFECHPMNVG